MSIKKTMYECDACGMRTATPWSYKMKEFNIEIDWIGAPVVAERKVKVHLCEGCYKSLQVIAKENVYGKKERN